METFDFAFDYLMQNEGMKYVNDPRDSGGPTKFGVTLSAYQNFMKRLVTADEIKNLSIDDAKSFYRATYWVLNGCDKIKNPATAVCIFDSSVLFGPQTAMMIAQKACGECGQGLKIDGFIGPKTVFALNFIYEKDFLAAFNKFLIGHIDDVIAMNSKNEAFKSGWVNRANRLLTLSNITSVITKTV